MPSIHTVLRDLTEEMKQFSREQERNFYFGPETLVRILDFQARLLVAVSNLARQIEPKAEPKNGRKTEPEDSPEPDDEEDAAPKKGAKRPPLAAAGAADRA